MACMLLQQLLAVHGGAPHPGSHVPCPVLSPQEVWGSGCCTLLGDAAHAMFPMLGQGASQSIEDAVVLVQASREQGRRVECWC